MRKRIISLLLLTALSFSLYAGGPSLLAEKGIIDLRNSELKDLKSIPLNGQWEFYWNVFIPADQIPASSAKTIVKVPSYWTAYKDKIPEITPFGFATYRLRILMPPGQKDSLCLKIPIFDTSYKLYLNNELIAENGIIGKKAESSLPSYQPLVHVFVNKSDTLDFTIHVSNFSHRRGGFWKPLILGERNYIIEKHERTKVINYALIGILTGTFLLFLTFFILERTNISFLYFSLTTLGILFRLLNTGIYPGNYLIDQQWIWTVRFEYLGVLTALAFGALYLDNIMPSLRVRKLVFINLYLSIVLAAIVLFSNVAFFSYTIIFPEVLGGIILLYYVYRGFAGMLKKKIQETAFFFSGILFLFALLNDTLVSLSLSPFNFEYLLPISFLGFIVIQAIMVIAEWSKNYKEKIKMHAELQYINQNLEKIIETRTKELNKTNLELQATIDFKSRMFSIIAHDLKSPISSLAQYSDLLMQEYSASDKAGITHEFHRLAYSSVDLIDNLLQWGMKQGRSIQYTAEYVSIFDICTSIKILTRLKVERKNITLTIQVPTQLKAYCDSSLLKIVLRNLVNNAIKFTPRNGQISIIGEEKEGLISIKVQDNGIGMEKEMTEKIFASNVSSTQGTEGEKGTGLGLMVVKDLVALNKGTLSIESKPGRGTTVMFTLPGKP